MKLVDFVQLSGVLHSLDETAFHNNTSVEHKHRVAVLSILTYIDGSNGSLSINSVGNALLAICESEEEIENLRSWLVQNLYSRSVIVPLLKRFMLNNERRLDSVIGNWLTNDIEDKADILIRFIIDKEYK